VTKLLWELKEDENVVKYCSEIDSMHKVSILDYGKGSLGLIFVNECLFATHVFVCVFVSGRAGGRAHTSAHICVCLDSLHVYRQTYACTGAYGICTCV
jgi:hypothetical protein